MINSGPEDVVRATIAATHAALIQLGQQPQYDKDWGSPVTGITGHTDSHTQYILGLRDGHAKRIPSRYESDLRLTGGQMRLSSTVNRKGNTVTFTCVVFGAREGSHYGTFVADANRLLQSLCVLEPGCERQLSPDTCS